MNRGAPTGRQRNLTREQRTENSEQNAPAGRQRNRNARRNILYETPFAQRPIRRALARALFSVLCSPFSGARSAPASPASPASPVEVWKLRGLEAWRDWEGLRPTPPRPLRRAFTRVLFSVLCSPFSGARQRPFRSPFSHASGRAHTAPHRGPTSIRCAPILRECRVRADSHPPAQGRRGHPHPAVGILPFHEPEARRLRHRV